ncbi:MAG: TCR/Tet family MFS transporter [Candidatus Pseudobacter hemicellulosilyticus]|uniref:TCR/Tet family MFS transporter n=1 Tax=Candidatus Pseudobacter hemicellulosilyticus TaxID=3121375 RepID=A0AAJ6BH25_9BACT|nr:MAG: TCR/Tet family MFS transporter [Pseudobacter sp.]
MKPTGSAAIGFIFVTLLIDVTGFGIVMPVMPRLIMELGHTDLSAASRYGGWMLFAYAIMQFLFAPLLGNLSDRYGRRPVLLFSLFGFGIDYLFLAFAPSLFWLFVGRVIAGITGASFTTATAYIADISTPDKRAQNFGIVGAAFGIGFILGPTIGGLLGSFGLRVPFLVAAGLTLLNWLYGFFVLPESLGKGNRRPFRWKRANPVGSLLHLKKYPAITGLVVSLILLYIGSHAVQTTWSFYGMEKFNWHEKEIGISLGVVGLMVGLVQGILIRKTIPLLGMEKSVYTGFFLYAIGMFLFGIAFSGWQMYAFTVVYCLGGIAGPALQGIISSQVPANEQGELQGGLTSLMSFTAVIGPPIMTSLFAYFTGKTAPVHLPGAPFLLGGALMLVSAWVAYRSLHNKKQLAPGQLT